jgi:hypothetical protein
VKKRAIGQPALQVCDHHRLSMRVWLCMYYSSPAAVEAAALNIGMPVLMRPCQGPLHQHSPSPPYVLPKSPTVTVDPLCAQVAAAACGAALLVAAKQQ